MKKGTFPVWWLILLGAISVATFIWHPASRGAFVGALVAGVIVGSLVQYVRRAIRYRRYYKMLVPIPFVLITWGIFRFASTAGFAWLMGIWAARLLLHGKQALEIEEEQEMDSLAFAFSHASDEELRTLRAQISEEELDEKRAIGIQKLRRRMRVMLFIYVGFALFICVGLAVEKLTK